MIKINVNNGRTIELTKIIGAKLINVDVIDSGGEVDYHYVITEAEIVTMLNEFVRKENIS